MYFYLRLLGICILLLSVPSTSFAVPLGLTTLETTGTSESSGVFVDDDTAYVSVYSATNSGVWTVTDTGNSFTAITHPTFGSPLGVTAPMIGPGGDMYVGATFLNFFSFETEASLFNLQNTSMPVVHWDSAFSTIGRALDAELNSYGTVSGAFAARLNNNGTITTLSSPPGFGGGDVLDVSASGVAVGLNERPGTLAAPAIWDGSGISFLDPTLNGSIYSVRDNLDGGLNFGAVLEGQAYVDFADFDLQALIDENGLALLADEVFVTESNFAVINTASAGPYIFYPELTTTLGQALPLGSVFPTLAGQSFTRAGRPTSVDGTLYLPLDGSINLFAALDPAITDADFDEDNDVDGADFLAWQRGFGTTSGASLANGDANGDGDVDGNDLLSWETQFGTGATALVATTAVPEPGCFGLALCYCAAMLLRTRRQHSAR